MNAWPAECPINKTRDFKNTRTLIFIYDKSIILWFYPGSFQIVLLLLKLDMSVTLRSDTGLFGLLKWNNDSINLPFPLRFAGNNLSDTLQYWLLMPDCVKRWQLHAKIPSNTDCYCMSVARFRCYMSGWMKYCQLLLNCQLPCEKWIAAGCKPLRCQLLLGVSCQILSN